MRYQDLRRIGFRIHSTTTSPHVHMVHVLSNKNETALEIGPYRDSCDEWCVWLRSDLAHSRCRFCYLRSVTEVCQVIALIEAISDRPPEVVDYCEATFAVSLAQEGEDCRRRYAEYCRNERWSYVPA